MSRGDKRIAAAAICALTLVLASCAGDSSDNSDSDQSSTPAPGQPVQGGTYVYAITSDPGTLNPDITTASQAQRAGCLMYEGLTWVDNDLVPQPALAKSWDVSEDGLTYTFQLQDGVIWHDGQPFSAEDAAWSLTNVSMTVGTVSSAPFQEYVSSIEATDESTVTIKLNRPYGPLLALLDCKSNTGILPKHLYEGTDIANNPHNTEDPVGTGPFKLQEWAPGEYLKYERNEDYWQADRPYLDAVVLQVIADPQAALQALQAGEVDAVGYETSAAVDLPQLVEGSGGALAEFPHGTMPMADALMFNTREGPLAQPEVRQAIATAIDTQSMIDRAYFGLGTVSKSAIASPEFANPAVDYSELYAYDPDRAKEMLEAAGFADGVTLRLAYEPARTGSEAATQIIRENLEAVGLTVQLEPMEHSVLAETVFAEHDFDLMFYILSQGVHPDLGVSRFFICSAIGTQAFTNGSGWCDPEVDDLFITGASGAAPDERKAAYFEAQERLAGVMNMLNLRDGAFLGVASTRVHGLENLGGADALHWNDIWVSE